MTDLSFQTIAELGGMLRGGAVSSAELTRHFLDRLERLGPKYNAVVTVLRDRALAEAAERDGELAAGRDRGPLHGIPYGAKDLLAAAGAPTTWGARPYREQLLKEDATVVRRLREAGAVLCAKLAMVELAGGMDTTRPSPASPDRAGPPGTRPGGPAGPRAGPAQRSAPGWRRSLSARRPGARSSFPPPSAA